MLASIAQGGLVDVATIHDSTGPTRRYWVRPEMLAGAIAVDHYFGGEVTLGEIDDLLTDWPERQRELIRAVCRAAQFGSVDARSRADILVDSVVGDDQMPAA